MYFLKMYPSNDYDKLMHKYHNPSIIIFVVTRYKYHINGSFNYNFSILKLLNSSMFKGLHLWF